MSQPKAGTSEALPVHAQSSISQLAEAQVANPAIAEDPEAIMAVFVGTVDSSTIAPSSTSTSTRTSAVAPPGSPAKKKVKKGGAPKTLMLTPKSRKMHFNKLRGESRKRKTAEVAALRNRVPFLECSLGEAKQALADRTAEWGDERGRLKGECDATRNALSELQQGTAAAHVKHLEGKVRRSEKKMVGAYKELEVQKGVTADLRGQLETYKREVESLRAAPLLPDPFDDIEENVEGYWKY